MKLTVAVLLMLVVGLTSCTQDENGSAEKSSQDEIQILLDRLRAVENPEEEKEILYAIWEKSSAAEDYSLGVSALDKTGKPVINDLAGGEPPINVSITISEKGTEKIWHQSFVPLDIDNVYILLNE